MLMSGLKKNRESVEVNPALAWFYFVSPLTSFCTSVPTAAILNTKYHVTRKNGRLQLG